MRVADRIRKARRAAGLTQAELARRSGTSQPAINRYERGAAVPNAATTSRILRACEVGRRPSQALREHRDEVLEILRRSGASTVLVFGSVARGEDGPGSDVDLLVDHLDKDSYVWGIPRAQDELQDLLGAKVDLGEVSSLRPSALGQVLADAQPL